MILQPIGHLGALMPMLTRLVGGRAADAVP